MGVEQDLNALKELLKKTFSNIKTDISVNSKEVERLHAYNRQLELKILKLEHALKETKPTEFTADKGLKAQILRKVDRNRKILIQKKILAMVASQELTLPELKDIMVQDQELCSKATFYRYLEELRAKGKIAIIQVNNLKILSIAPQISQAEP